MSARSAPGHLRLRPQARRDAARHSGASAEKAEAEASLQAATTQLAALNALAQRAGQRVGTCPNCGQEITGHDLLATGQCRSCHQTLSDLIVPERTAPSLDQRELLVLVGALGAVLAIAYIASK